MNKENQKIEYKLSWRDEYLKWIDGVKNYPGKRPNYDIDDDSVMVCYEACEKYVNLLKNDEDVTQGITNVTNVTNVTNHNIEETIDDLDANILNLMLKNSNISTLEIATICKTTKRTIIRHIDKLKKSNKLKYVGKTNNGHWEIIRETSKK